MQQAWAGRAVCKATVCISTQQGSDTSSISVLGWQVLGHCVPGVPVGVWGGLWLKMLLHGHWAFISTGFYPAARPAHSALHSARLCSASLSCEPRRTLPPSCSAHWCSKGEWQGPLQPHCRSPSGRKTSLCCCMASLCHGHSHTVNAFRGIGSWRRQEMLAITGSASLLPICVSQELAGSI